MTCSHMIDVSSVRGSLTCQLCPHKISRLSWWTAFLGARARYALWRLGL